MTIKVKITRPENATYFGKNVNNVVEVELEEYVAAVVASEIGNSHIEACKAQAVAARTFAYPYYSKGSMITDSSSTHQAYRAPRYNVTQYPNAIQAATETAGQLLTYNGSVITSCVYSESNGGRTTSSKERWGGERAWLIAQDDPWDAAGGTGKTGHGVGMSQRGARYAAGIGIKYDAILAFYYPGTVLTGTARTTITKEDTTMITAKAFVEKVHEPLTEGWGYIWGAAGETWTSAKQKAATREQTVKWGSRWIGKRVCDCSGLLYWAAKQLGGYIYHGSNTIFKKYTTVTGKLKGGARTDGQPLKPGTAMFLYNTSNAYHHVGVYVGGGVVIESRGTIDGVITSSPAVWDYWGELKDIDYTNAMDLEKEVIKMDTVLYTATVTTASGTLNLRRAPKTGAIITRLARNSTVDVYMEQDGWMYVKHGNYEGWVSGEFLTKAATNDSPADGDADAPDVEQPAATTSNLLITDSAGNTFKPVGSFTVKVVSA